MKSIKFTDDELDFLRTQYQLELVEAEKYVQEVKNLLEKLGVPTTEDETPAKRKPGRKRKQAQPIEEVPVTKVKRGRKPKSESPEILKEIKVKATKVGRKKPLKKVKTPVADTQTPKLVNEQAKRELPNKDKPKKKTVRKSYKRRGIVLKNLSKPLPKKEQSIANEPEVQTSESQKE
jgi:hypothetical protein